MITYADFRRVDMRVGRVLDVKDFPGARKPSYRLEIDFGPNIGVKESSAQITGCKKDELIGRLVIAVVNFPPKQIADFQSEVLTLGVADKSRRNNWFLIQPDREVELGSRVEYSLFSVLVDLFSIFVLSASLLLKFMHACFSHNSNLPALRKLDCTSQYSY